MSSNRKNSLILVVVSAATAVMVLLYLDKFGASDDNLLVMLRLTARLAFLVYLLVFIARPIRQLVRTNATRWLLNERRSLGLSMAAIHFVHMGLIIYRATHSPEFEFDFPAQIIGSLIYTLMLLMVITSFDAPARVIGAQTWRRLHKTGLYALGVAFVSTLLPEARAELLEPERLWFIVLTAIAVFIRLTAFFARRSQSNG